MKNAIIVLGFFLLVSCSQDINNDQVNSDQSGNTDSQGEITQEDVTIIASPSRELESSFTSINEGLGEE